MTETDGTQVGSMDPQEAASDLLDGDDEPERPEGGPRAEGARGRASEEEGAGPPPGLGFDLWRQALEHGTASLNAYLADHPVGRHWHLTEQRRGALVLPWSMLLARKYPLGPPLEWMCYGLLAAWLFDGWRKYERDARARRERSAYDKARPAAAAAFTPGDGAPVADARPGDEAAG